MSLEIREVHDAAAWDATILGLPGAELEQGWAWGEIQTGSGWRVHRHEVNVDGQCVAAISIVARWLPGLGSILYAPRGPVLNTKHPGAGDALRMAIQRVADATQAVFLRVSPGARHDPAVHDALLDLGFRHVPGDFTIWNTPRVVLTLDLGASEGELRRRVRKTTRYEIGAAERRGVSVRVARDAADVAAFHGMLVAMGKEKGYPVRGVERLESLWSHYVAGGAGVLLLAEHEGVVVAGLFAVQFGRYAYLRYATVRRDAEVTRLHPGPLVYWEFIRWAKTAGCEAIDWGGSGTHYPPRPEDMGYGVCRFKMSFGSTLACGLGYYDLVFRPLRYRALVAAERHLLPRAWRWRARFNR